MASEQARTNRLSEFAVGIEFRHLPESVVKQAKRCILDTIGCGLFGSTLPWSRLLVDTVSTFGTGKTRVWGTALHLPLDTAVLVNGTAVHSFELDDLHKRAILHPGGVTIPAVFAVAEQGHEFSGPDVITAVVAGYEVAIRVGLATGLGLLHAGWHNNGVLGTFGGAAGVGRLVGLGSDQMEHALGMAATQSGGLMSAQYGSMVKRMHAGKAAQSGLYAALLAKGGFSGITSVFEREYGGFPGPFTTESNLDLLLTGIGAVWEIENVGCKYYPTCGSSHTAIDAVLSLRSQYEFHVDDIARCIVRASSATTDHVGWVYEPGSVTTAQMNLPYAVACALIRGKVTVGEFDETLLSDPALVALAQRVTVVPDSGIDGGGASARHTVDVTLELTDGRRIERRVEHAKGSEFFPLTDSEVEAKYLDLAGRAVGREKALAIQTAVAGLDTANDAHGLIDLLGSGSPERALSPASK